MRAAQYVSQKAVKDFDVQGLSDAEQDVFIREVNESLVRDMRERTKDARPLEGRFYLEVTGPHQDPIQGVVHVHKIVASFDMDTLPAEAQFRKDWLAAMEEGTASAPLAGGEAVQ